MRGLCNVWDGLMAVEGGLKTRSGAVFNELPDRISDPIILVCAGYCVSHTGWGPALGWSAALLAVIAAYVRALGSSLGASQHFCGPMAKPRRMAIMGAAFLIAAAESAIGSEPRAVGGALVIVAVGCVATILRRTRRIVRELEAR